MNTSPALNRGAREGLSPAEVLLQRYLSVRGYSESLASRLGREDMVVQAMDDTSPTKWHLAHTSWFFETFLLKPYLLYYQIFNPSYAFLFNSYYESMGPRLPRPRRGLLTRPTVDDVMNYRAHVDKHMIAFLKSGLATEVESMIQLGLAHEEQHQELILMDILYLFSLSPMNSVFDREWSVDIHDTTGTFAYVRGGTADIGADGTSFAFDNERPRHRVLLSSFEISQRLVTQHEWLQFMNDGGYRRPELWLSDGWARVKAEGWEAPLYWMRDGRRWKQMTLRGMEEVSPSAAVTHISYFEAAAYATWANARLPTEAEWEIAARNVDVALRQVGDIAWQWTSSAYAPYPRFKAPKGAVGEYNGKFMSGQMVLRGGASVTPEGHGRHSYRNFYYPHQRWMFSGVRLAKDIDETPDTQLG